MIKFILEHPIVFTIFIIAVSFGCFWLLYLHYNRMKKSVDEFASSYEKTHDIPFNAQDTLQKGFLEIWVNSEEKKERKIVKTDASDYLTKKLITEFKHLLWYRVSGYFTGLALIFTFLLIGIAVHDIGQELQSRITTESVKNLGKPIEDLQYKFFVSIAGIAVSIFYQIFGSILADKLFKYSKGKLQKCFADDHPILHEFRDLEMQRIQATDVTRVAISSESIGKSIELHHHSYVDEIEQIKAKLDNLQKIDVTIDALAETVEHRLSDAIDKSVGHKLTELIQAQNNMTEKISNEIGKALADSIGTQMKEAFGKLAEELPKIVSGGASDATAKMAEAVTLASASFKSVSESLPDLISSLKSVISQMQSQQENVATESKRATGELFLSIERAIKEMNQLQSSAITRQQELVNSVYSAIEQLSASASRASEDNASKMAASTKEVELSLGKGAQLFNGSLDQLKILLGEAEKTSKNAFEMNDALVKSSQRILADLGSSVSTVSSVQQGLVQSIERLGEISTSLTNAPREVRALAETVASSIKDQEQSLASMASTSKKVMEDLSNEFNKTNNIISKEFINNLEAIGGTYKTSIENIKINVKEIERVVNTASNAIKNSVDSPIEDLVEALDELTKATKIARS